MLNRLATSVLLLLTPLALAADPTATPHRPGPYLSKPDAFFATPEARRIADNILSFQSDSGGWPKNVDTVSAPYAGNDPETDLKPTFDNSATTDEIRVLARVVTAAPKDAPVDRYRAAAVKGIDYVLKAQYPTGGWPQFYPPSKQYHRHITFNDNAMVRLMEFLREADTSPRFAVLDAPHRAAARDAFDRGVECILRCQVKQGDKLTAWCAQHDELDYSPRPGRAFELVSLSGAESVGITRLLMSLDHPSPRVIQSVDGAVAWFKSVKLTGLRITQVDDPSAPRGKDKRVIPDPNAPPIWARFYDIPTNQPLFSDRDGIPRANLKDLGYERRNGYAWYGDWPTHLLDTEYPAWKARHTP